MIAAARTWRLLDVTSTRWSLIRGDLLRHTGTHVAGYGWHRRSAARRSEGVDTRVRGGRYQGSMITGDHATTLRYRGELGIQGRATGAEFAA
jgi:hypothetical protein